MVSTATFGEAVDLHWEATGAAATSTRLGSLSGVVSFPAARRQAKILVPLLDNSIREGDGTVTITLVGVDEEWQADVTVDPVRSAATVTVEDNDLVTVALSAPVLEAVEGGAPVTVTVVLSDAPQAESLLIPLTSILGGRAADADWVAPTPLAVTIGAGRRSGSISVAALADTIWEGNRAENVTLGIGELPFGYQPQAEQDRLTITFIEGGSPPIVTAHLVVGGDGSLSEEATTPATATLRVTVDQSIVRFADDHTITLRGEAGAATVGEDYTLSHPSIFIPAGAAVGSPTVTITILDDDLVEIDEQLAFDFAIDGLPEDAVVIQAPPRIPIGDADVAMLAIEDAPTTVSEGESVTVVVSLSASVAQTLEVALEMVEGSGFDKDDISLDELSGNVNFAANAAPGVTQSFTFQVLDDDDAEAEEEILIRLQTLPDALAPGVILDSDNQTRRIAVLASDQTGAGEGIPQFQFSGNAAVTLREGETHTVQVVRTGAALDGRVNIPIVVHYQGGATATDLPVPRDVNFPAGETPFVNLRITAEADGVWDGGRNESVVISLGPAPNGTGYSTNRRLEVNITDTDSAPTLSGSVALSSGTHTELQEANRGITATISLTADFTDASPFEEPRTVTLGEVAGGAKYGSDYILSARRVTISAGVATWAETVTLSVIDDSVIEGPETLRLTATVDGTGAVVLPLTGNTFTISDNDVATAAFITPSLTTSVTEGITVELNVRLTHALARTVQVPWQITGGGITAADLGLNDLTGHQLEFPAGVGANATRAISIAIAADDEIEAMESFTVELMAPTGASAGLVELSGSNSTRDLTIQAHGNNLTIVPVNSQVTEGSKVLTEFRIQLGRALAVDANVNYRWNERNSTVTAADFVPNPAAEWDAGVVSLTAGATAATLAVPLSLDAVVELTETYTVELVSIRQRNSDGTDGDPLPEVALAQPVNATVTVADADTATVSIGTAPTTGAEGESITIPVTLSAGIAHAVTVPVTLSGAGITSMDVESQMLVGGEVTFPADSGPGAVQNFVIELRADHVAEPEESLTVTLGAPTGGIADRVTVGNVHTHMLTIAASEASLSTAVGFAGAGTRAIVEGGTAAPITLVFDPPPQEAFALSLILHAPPAPFTTDQAIVEFADELALRLPGTTMPSAIDPVNDVVRYELQIPAGVTRFDLQVSALADTRWEAGQDEIVALGLELDAMPAGVAHHAEHHATVLLEIVDATAQPNLSLVVDQATVAEDGTVADRTVTITLNVESGLGVATVDGDRTVALIFGTGTGVTSTDFTVGEAPTITRRADGTGTGYELRVEPDTVPEADEVITITGMIPGLPTVTITPVTVTITDDDRGTEPIVELTVTSTTPTMPQEGDAVTVALMAGLAGGATAATETEVIIDLPTADGVVISEVTPSQLTIAIAANATSGTGNFTLTLLEDMRVEADVTVPLAGTATGHIVRGANVTIADDDEVIVELVPVRTAFTGNGTLTYTVRATEAAGTRGMPITVDFEYFGDAIPGGVDFAFADPTHASRNPQLEIPATASAVDIAFHVENPNPRTSGRHVGIRLVAVNGEGNVRLGDRVSGRTRLEHGTGPHVQRLWFASTPTDSALGYGAGDVVRVNVQFNQAVVLSGATGTADHPVLLLQVGDATRTMVQSGTDGADTMIFTYTVVDGVDADGDGITVLANSLRLRGAGELLAGPAMQYVEELRHPAVDGGTTQRVAGGRIGFSTTTLDVAEGTSGLLLLDITPPYTGAEAIVIEGQFTGALTKFALGTDGDAVLHDEIRETNARVGQIVRITVPPRAAVASIDVQALADNVWEVGSPADEITVVLTPTSLPAGYRMQIAGNRATVTLADATPAPQLQLWVARPTLDEGELFNEMEQGVSSGQNHLEFGTTELWVALAAGSSVPAQTLTANLTFAGSATRGLVANSEDYTVHSATNALLTGTVTLSLLPQTTRSEAVEIKLHEDDTDEATEMIRVSATVVGHEASVTVPAATINVLDSATSAALAVIGGAITSAPADPKGYRVGETIIAELLLNKLAQVGTVGGEVPTVALALGATAGEIRTATYSGSHGAITYTHRLQFAYQVQRGDVSTDGVRVRENTLRIPATTVTRVDLVGDVGTETLADGVNPGLPANPNHKILGAPRGSRIDPQATRLAVISTPINGDTYLPGEAVEVATIFNDRVFVEDTFLALTITVGTSTKNAIYVRGSGSRQLVFRMPVAAADWAANGVAVAADSMQMTPGENPVRDAQGIVVDVAHMALAAQPGHKVAGQTVSFASPSITVREGNTVELRVEFSPPLGATDTVPVTAQAGRSTTAAEWSVNVTASTNVTADGNNSFTVAGDAAEAIIAFQAATDMVWEPGLEETVTFTLGDLPTMAEVAHGRNRAIVVTITDADSPPTAARVRFASETFSEDSEVEADRQVAVTLVLGDADAVFADNREIAFAVGTGGTAQLGVDFSIPDSFVATLRAGQRTSEAVAITALTDVLVEGPESVVLTAMIAGSNVVAVPVDSGRVMITDSADQVTVDIAGPATVAEGTTATYTVTTNAELGGQDLLLPIEISGTDIDASDFVDPPTVLRIPARAAAGTFSVHLEISEVDEFEAAESFTIGLGRPLGGPLREQVVLAGGGGGFTTSIAANVLRDPESVLIAVVDTALTEADLVRSTELTVRLVRGAYAEDRIVTVSIGAESTATVGEDFSITGGRINSSNDGWEIDVPMERSIGTQALTITVIDDDDVLEEQESIPLTVSISGETTADLPGLTLTIDNDDDLTIDVNNDGSLDSADGLILFYALQGTTLLGTDNPDPRQLAFRHTFIGPYLVNSTDSRMSILLAKIHASAEVGRSSPLNFRGADRVSSVDGILLYHASQFAQLYDSFPDFWTEMVRGYLPQSTPEELGSLRDDINALIATYE